MPGVNGLYSLLTEAGADENVVDIVSRNYFLHKIGLTSRIIHILFDKTNTS